MAAAPAALPPAALPAPADPALLFPCRRHRASMSPASAPAACW